MSEKIVPISADSHIAEPGLMAPDRLLWAIDFPHFDSIWPNSKAVVERSTEGRSRDQCRHVLRDDVAELYRLPV